MLMPPGSSCALLAPTAAELAPHLAQAGHQLPQALLPLRQLAAAAKVGAQIRHDAVHD